MEAFVSGKLSKLARAQLKNFGLITVANSDVNALLVLASVDNELGFPRQSLDERLMAT